MGVLQAHGVSINQIKNYDSIATIKNFSIAEYVYNENRETIDSFFHEHDEYEFIIPVNTIPLLVYDNANYIGEVGYIYPVNPKTRHGIVFPLGESRCFDITASAELVDKVKSKLGLDGKYFQSRIELPLDLFDIISEFQRESLQDSTNHQRLDILAELILTSILENGLGTPLKSTLHEKKYRKNIKSMIFYMYKNYQDADLNISELAEKSGYSLAYFTKAFKAFMDYTPIVYLNRLRISEAKSLLYSGASSFSDIYEKVGYKNLSSFTEAFKRVCGVTPSEYKQSRLKR